MSIDEVQNEIIEEFALYDNWEDRYEHLIELGKSLPATSHDFKQDSKLIKGCQSKVWLDVQKKGDTLEFVADSDAILPKGIAALLVRIFSHQTAQDIVQSKPYFIEKIGLQEFLSPTRANGLLAMIKQIKLYAITYQLKEQRKEKNG